MLPTEHYLNNYGLFINILYLYCTVRILLLILIFEIVVLTTSNEYIYEGHIRKSY